MPAYQRFYAWQVRYRLVDDANDYFMTTNTEGTTGALIEPVLVAFPSKAAAEEVADELRKDRDVVKSSVVVRMIRTT